MPRFLKGRRNIVGRRRKLVPQYSDSVNALICKRRIDKYFERLGRK